MKKFIIGRVKSVKYAFKGFYILITTEHSIISQLFVFFIFVALGFYFNISPQDWINQTLAFGSVFVAESLNTAIEEVTDFIHPGRHEKIGKIKDIAAGAVTFAALATFIVICITYYPYVVGV